MAVIYKKYVFFSFSKTNIFAVMRINEYYLKKRKRFLFLETLP